MNNLRVFLVVKKYRKLWWWLPLFIGALIALFSPLDVLNVPLASDTVCAIAVIVPMVSNLAGNYELSQVAQFYFAVMWIFFPLVFYSFDVGVKEKLLEQLKHNHKFLWLLFLTMATLWLFLMYFFYYVGPSSYESTGADFFMLHSRFGLAIYGGAIFLAFVVQLKYLLQVSSCFFNIYFQGEKR